MEKQAPSFHADQYESNAGSGSVVRSSFASLSLHNTDRVRLMSFPIEIQNAIRQSIVSTWPKGIQKEGDYAGSWEFKLSGNPWESTGDSAIHARHLTRGLLATLYSHGWILYVAADISRNEYDTDSLFFRHQQPAPSPCEWFSVTFSKGDKLRLIDAPQEVVNDVVNALVLKVQRHQPYDVPGTYEIKLQGYPFAASGGRTMESRVIALQLLNVFEARGFSIYASVNQKHSSTYETDTWHVCRPLGWTPRLPVYHQ